MRGLDALLSADGVFVMELRDPQSVFDGPENLHKLASAELRNMGVIRHLFSLDALCLPLWVPVAFHWTIAESWGPSSPMEGMSIS